MNAPRQVISYFKCSLRIDKRVLANHKLFTSFFIKFFFVYRLYLHSSDVEIGVSKRENVNQLLELLNCLNYTSRNCYKLNLLSLESLNIKTYRKFLWIILPLFDTTKQSTTSTGIVFLVLYSYYYYLSPVHNIP